VSPGTSKPARLYQQVVEKLAATITAREYAIGDRLPAERELATLYGVSRPTIREAIIALEIEGIVEARTGSGVYVIAVPTTEGVKLEMDVGPFELTEARLLIEGEAAALAATLIAPGELQRLDELLLEMAEENKQREGAGVVADREFHQIIADATRNSAISAVIESLWTIRERSPQCVRLFTKTRAKGFLPVVDEHRAIVDALRAHDSTAARAAMRNHLKRVLNYLLDATEVEAIEEAKRKIEAQRNRYSAKTRLPLG
jgi:GntR family transcriptional regulator, hexuronate regulon transcriptional repressor